MKILVINCGSSSAKFQLFDIDTGDVLAKGNAERIGIDGKLTYKPTGKDEFVSTEPMPDHKVAVRMILDALVDKDHGVIADVSEIAAVGHRVLHGGKYYSESVIVNDDVRKSLETASLWALSTIPQTSSVSRHARMFFPQAHLRLLFSIRHSIRQCPQRLTHMLFLMSSLRNTTSAVTVSMVHPTVM